MAGLTGRTAAILVAVGCLLWAVQVPTLSTSQPREGLGNAAFATYIGGRLQSGDAI